ncbi:MAG: multidrug effflux MFS transporter [Kiritimatiellaeota bacterium]|nr:multidrug effflux MFS transporter [Kiritimatiellota bacterium]
MPEQNKHVIIKGVKFSVFQFAALLFLISSVARLAGSLYLPSLIEIGRELSLSDALLSETLTVYFTAFAISTLFAGALADSFGRKKVVFGGVVVFVCGSFLCAMAGSAETLILARVLQAIGASCVPVAGRAMIRDACDDRQVLVVLGWMAALGGLVPILAPMLGGLITDTLGWRWNFWFLAVFAIVISILIAVKLPETLDHGERRPLHLVSILANYAEMLKSPAFILVLLPLELAFGVQGAYLASSPFIFIKTFGLSPLTFGMMNVIVVGALIGGRFLATFLIDRASTYFAYVFGASLLLLGGSVLALLDVSRCVSLTTVLGGLSIAVGGFGVLLPIGLKSVMTAFRSRSGSASALHGCLSLGAVAGGSFLFSVIKSTAKIDDLSSMARFTIVAGTAALFFSLLTKKHLK